MFQCDRKCDANWLGCCVEFQLNASKLQQKMETFAFRAVFWLVGWLNLQNQQKEQVNFLFICHSNWTDRKYFFSSSLIKVKAVCLHFLSKACILENILNQMSGNAKKGREKNQGSLKYFHFSSCEVFQFQVMLVN